VCSLYDSIQSETKCISALRSCVDDAVDDAESAPEVVCGGTIVGSRLVPPHDHPSPIRPIQGFP